MTLRISDRPTNHDRSLVSVSAPRCHVHIMIDVMAVSREPARTSCCLLECSLSLLLGELTSGRLVCGRNFNQLTLAVCSSGVKVTFIVVAVLSRFLASYQRLRCYGGNMDYYFYMSEATCVNLISFYISFSWSVCCWTFVVCRSLNVMLCMASITITTATTHDTAYFTNNVSHCTQRHCKATP